MNEVTRTSKERYESQPCSEGNVLAFRVTDTKTDSRLATCYLADNAELICKALNAYSGHEPPAECSRCRGSGEVRAMTQEHGPDDYEFDAECPECKGVGVVSRAAQPPSAPHPDDEAVDLFAAAMKAKLAKKRGEGRGGWDDPNRCSITHLRNLLHEHVPKGDMVDIGNFAMMIWNRFKAWDDAARSGITKCEGQS